MVNKELEELTDGEEPVKRGRGDRRRTRLSWIVQLYFDIEKLRVSQRVRITHLMLQNAEIADDTLMNAIEVRLTDVQTLIDKQMEPYVLPHACWTEFCQEVKGIGPHLLALVMGEIRDVAPLTNVAKCWWLCGLAVVDGKALRLQKGQVANYNMRLKSVLLGRIGPQFLKNADPFARLLYDTFRAREEIKEPKGAHARALRKVVKLWVACLWAVWRKSEGLEVPDPYPIAYLQHTDTITAEEWVKYNLAHKKPKVSQQYEGAHI